MQRLTAQFLKFLMDYTKSRLVNNSYIFTVNICLNFKLSYNIKFYIYISYKLKVKVITNRTI